jgi:membrane fusion protein (multidrug efflux system)
MKMHRLSRFRNKHPGWIVLIMLAFIFINVAVFHVYQYISSKHYFQQKREAPITVATIDVSYKEWQPSLSTLGSLRAVQGVMVTTEVDGLVREIYFKANQQVKAGDPLVQLNADDEIAALQSLQAAAKLASITYERDKVQSSFDGVSKEVLDTDQYNMLGLNAQVAQQEALIAKKTIRAPFDGKLGISTLNKGQFIAAGEAIVGLQNINTLYVDFYTPEQNLPQLLVGQQVNILSDTYPDQLFTGTLTAVNPQVDAATRNIKVEAIIPNAKSELLPGMYARVEVITAKPKAYLTIPQSAVSFNPYGTLAYVVETNEKNSALYARQRFITLGKIRGDQIQVLEGLKEGEKIVAAGQLKLKNNSPIVINNKTATHNDANANVGMIPEN